MISPLLLLAVQLAHPVDSTVHLQVGDTVRTYELHIPAHSPDRPLTGIVLTFHGAGGSARGFRSGTRFDSTADRHGWVVAWADAPLGNWAEDCRCNNADRLGVNDTGFVRGMVAELRKMDGLAEVPVYAIGFSQGGLFAHRVACQMADLVTGVAMVAGPMSKPLSERCTPSRPVSMLVMLGMNDQVFNWKGSGRGALSVLGGEATFDVWSRLNGCTGKESKKPPPSIPTDDRFRWRWNEQCREGSRVVLLGAEGVGHGWTMSRRVDTGEVVGAFFEEVEVEGRRSEVGGRRSKVEEQVQGRGPNSSHSDHELGFNGDRRRAPPGQSVVGVRVQQRSAALGFRRLKVRAGGLGLPE